MKSLSKLIVASSLIWIWSLLWPKSALAQTQTTTSIKETLTQTQNLLWEVNDQSLSEISYWEVSFKLDYNHLWENNTISNIEIYHLWELIVYFLRMHWHLSLLQSLKHDTYLVTYTFEDS